MEWWSHGVSQSWQSLIEWAKAASPVFDFATFLSAILAPILTIFGWRYVSRNERRLDLMKEGRAVLLDKSGVYLDWARDLRNALREALDAPLDPERIGVVRNLLAEELPAWIAFVQVRDLEAVFPEARPIREAIVQNHRRMLVAAAEAGCTAKDLDERSVLLADAHCIAGEFVQGILALRVAISNAVTNTLTIRHKYGLADPGIRFAVVAVPEADYYGLRVPLSQSLRLWQPRPTVWLLSGATECPDAWTYDAAASLDSGVSHHVRGTVGRLLPARRAIVQRPVGMRKLSGFLNA